MTPGIVIVPQLAGSFFLIICHVLWWVRAKRRELLWTDLINPAPAVHQGQLVTAALPPVEET